MRLAILFFTLFSSLLLAGSPVESMQELVARLNPAQKALWDQGLNAFNAQRYGDALIVYKQLLEQLPNNTILSKFASESALNSGDTSYALTMLKPIAASDANDWQATSLLARACAESGDAGCRDSNMEHLKNLHQQGIAPRGLQQYVVERLKLGDKTLYILPSLEPIGFYKIYDLCRVMDATGKIPFRITVESGDGDQITFAKEHPKEAAAGIRKFSLDAYQETGLNSNGQRTQTHFTYRFYVGQPSYETIRQDFIDVVSGKISPASSRTGLVVQ